jgi:integrase
MANSSTVPLTGLVRRYLDHRRALGFLLPRHDLPLSRFARFHQSEAPGKPLQTAVMLKWATLPNTGGRDYHVKRLSIVRGFAKYCAALDARTQIPDYRLLGRGYTRLAPHIYTDQQIALLLQRARQILPRRSPLRPFTYETLLGLIACTGLRTCEALRLRCDDFDAGARTLKIRRTKFSPERILPLHATTARALQSYLDARLPLMPGEASFFINRNRRPLRPGDVQQTFRKIASGIPSNGARALPRIYDLRHTFATRHIACWNQAGDSVAHRLLLLSRYMGHQNFSDTWWYVSADAKTLRTASTHFERFFKGGSRGR